MPSAHAIVAAYAKAMDIRDNATEARDNLAKTMTPAQIAEAQKRAKERKKK